MPDHYPEEPFFVRALTELQEIEETMAIAVSDIDSFDPCKIPGCPHHERTPQNYPNKLTQSTPKMQDQTNTYGKRKDNSNFEYPPLRKTARKIILDIPTNEVISISPNKFTLPQENQLNNLENPGSVANENNPLSHSEENRNNGSNNSTNQIPTQNQLPPPIMLFIEGKLQSTNGRYYERIS
ncbi:hypothetical protein TNCV_4148911 [Trichonephila clavipes]|nr:hypothetical protein TNCV_4148911 [Trichonephila clavipes]